VQHVWETIHDDRDCTPCKCGSPGTTCTVTTQLFTDGACQSSAIGLGAPGQCTDAASVLSAQATVSISGSPSCPASGGSPTGSVTATPVTTICCPGP
jgi:hypothetical protein